ncbi:DNA polymerase III subunit epsilon [Rosistilla oblonga]|uniref:3'-5' exonuclease n=1 Tax=Rosistilla oblonga TaxID=2527990 RepID=UPI00118A3EB4|nr:3'-5' exonuclease [Rosistilla oblonga]QDV11248.1 DNA polymerase III subunit epsilon [Rosistilla oblonga]
MYLFFDTETSGLPRNFYADESDTNNWPRVVQLAWVIAESGDTVKPLENHLIRPDGFKIDSGATRVHGITTAFARENGRPLRPILDSFLAAVASAKTVVAHNVDFDTNIIGAECARIGIPNPLRRKPLLCTMKESVDFCRIPSHRGFKWPKLDELHAKLFQSEFDNAHDASSDCLACMRCFFRLKELRAI